MVDAQATVSARLFERWVAARDLPANSHALQVLRDFTTTAPNQLWVADFT